MYVPEFIHSPVEIQLVLFPVFGNCNKSCYKPSQAALCEHKFVVHLGKYLEEGCHVVSVFLSL